MTEQFRFTPAQRAAFRADPPGWAVGGADRVLTDIERAINQAGVGPVEEFTFSDEDRAAIREAVLAAVLVIADAAGVVSPSLELDAAHWVSDEDFTAIEAEINRDRASDPVMTVRVNSIGGTGVAIRRQNRWQTVYDDDTVWSSPVAGPRALELPSWPVVYRPEADS